MSSFVFFCLCLYLCSVVRRRPRNTVTYGVLEYWSIEGRFHISSFDFNFFLAMLMAELLSE